MRWRNRLAAAATAPVIALLGTASPAVAAPLGGITVTPANSIDTAPIRVRTSSGCPAKADNYYAIARGHGFPPTGQIVTTPTAAGLSHRDGFDVYFAQTMKDFAADNHTTLNGRYDVTVYCVDSFTRNSFGEFSGSLTFTSPTRYVSVAAAATLPPDPPAAQAAPEPDRDSTPPVWVLVAVVAAVLVAFEAGRRLGRAQRS